VALTASGTSCDTPEKAPLMQRPIRPGDLGGAMSAVAYTDSDLFGPPALIGAGPMAGEEQVDDALGDVVVEVVEVAGDQDEWREELE
jgi:hypothetical protein